MTTLPADVSKACGICTRRHSVQAGGADTSRLECRALPPRQDVAMYALYPLVNAETGFCHTYFELDQAALAARSAAEAARVADLAAVVAPLVDEAGAPVNPPAGDLAADLAEPNVIAPAITDEVRAQYPHLTDAQIAALDQTPSDGRTSPGGSPKGPRARRARGDGGEPGPLL